jgi:hypothetical protein
MAFRPWTAANQIGYLIIVKLEYYEQQKHMAEKQK